VPLIFLLLAMIALPEKALILTNNKLFVNTKKYSAEETGTKF